MASSCSCWTTAGSHHRSDDRGGLGDWEVDTAKLPGGLKGFAEKLNAMGLQFGLWIEPEMVNAGTRMWDEHPDWVLHRPGRRPQPSRHQYVLDYSNPDVVDFLYRRLEALLDGVPVSYIKWDMNRSISDAFSCAAGPAGQGEVLHRYILGLYRPVRPAHQPFPADPVRVLRLGRRAVRPGHALLRPPVLDQRRHRRGGAAQDPVRHQLCLPCLQHGGPCGSRPQPPAESYHLLTTRPMWPFLALSAMSWT